MLNIDKLNVGTKPFGFLFGHKFRELLDPLPFIVHNNNISSQLILTPIM